MVTNEPPLVSLSIHDQAGEVPKDTPANIKATKQFVVNIISEPFIEQANCTCVDSPPDVSEWTFSGLTKAPSVRPRSRAPTRSDVLLTIQVLVKPPRVKESAFSMECEVGC